MWLPESLHPGRLPLLFEVVPHFEEYRATRGVFLGGIFNSAAEHLEGVFLRLLVDLQEAKGLADEVGDYVTVGRGLAPLDAFGDHFNRIDLGHNSVLRLLIRPYDTPVNVTEFATVLTPEVALRSAIGNQLGLQKTLNRYQPYAVAP